MSKNAFVLGGYVLRGFVMGDLVPNPYLWCKSILAAGRDHSARIRSEMSFDYRDVAALFHPPLSPSDLEHASWISALN